MAEPVHLNLRTDVDDSAPGFGLEGMEARFANLPLGLEALGMSLQGLAPGARQAFGHRHPGGHEEVYVVVEGTGRANVDGRIVELAPLDALRVPGPAWRCFEAGPQGLLFLALGAPPLADPAAGSEMVPGWWG
ncbi:MAG: cupin domain-containing protein [Thermoleophilia bacterium]